MPQSVLSFNLMETVDPQTPLDPERVIGREMRRIRERLGLTQQEVAERMLKNGFRFHQTQIAKMERGERPIRVNEWIAITIALGMTPQDMLSSAISASVGESVEERLSLAELERERDALEVRLQDVEERVKVAEKQAAIAKAAVDTSQAAARDAEMRLVEAHTLANELAAVREHLRRRIWDARVREREAEKESALDSVLNEAEQTIAALDGLVEMSIGKRLASARRQAGMTVEDVATAMSLDPGGVETLEEPDYSKIVKLRLGVGTKRRSENLDQRHAGMQLGIRRYAAAVGVDPEPLIKQYKAEMMGEKE